MRTTHTPGPWRHEVDGPATSDTHHGVVAECNDLWVAACYRSGTCAANERGSEAEAEAKANARLIAAAPDLLAALVSFTKSDYIKKQHPKRYAAAVKAIARCTPQPPCPTNNQPLNGSPVMRLKTGG